jgi:hypothetical protein
MRRAETDGLFTSNAWSVCMKRMMRFAQTHHPFFYSSNHLFIKEMTSCFSASGSVLMRVR